MEFSFMAKINAPKETVWDYYADVQKWYAWEDDLKNITLDGGFQTGSSGIMELEGMPPLNYLLTSVKDPREFWDSTSTPMGDILFGHEIFENGDGTVNVRHTVRLQGETVTAEALGFLKQIFSDVPDSVLALKEKAER